MGCCIIVEESQIAVIENCGKFSRVEPAGCAPLNCWCEKQAGIISLRIDQYDLDIETRTQDNVFVTIKLAMRVKVAESDVEFPKPRAVKKIGGKSKNVKLVETESPENKDHSYAPLQIEREELLYRAFYKLENPVSQISAYIDNYFRFHAMLFTLDDMYAAKDGMTNELLNELNAKMNPYGYIVYDILVKDILPNTKVRDAMNDVVASEKEKIATVNRAQAEKASKILGAEAEARTRELEGEGIAAARRAIVEGLRQSVDEFQEAIQDTDARELLTVVLMTQYMDTLKEAATKSKNTFVLPSSPAQVSVIEEQMRQALIPKKKGEKTVHAKKSKETKKKTTTTLEGKDSDDE
jgi:regulator of protease activity HflC (stomatin/prohibitin superfamily)